MKTYIVKFDCWHESFGGHDHRDDDVTFVVEAINPKSAQSKAKKRFYKEYGGRWWRNSEVEER